MTYFEGFVLSVPTGNKQSFTSHAGEVADAAREFGVARQVEAWEDDVPEGKVTDFRKAVNATPDEVAGKGGKLSRANPGDASTCRPRGRQRRWVRLQ